MAKELIAGLETSAKVRKSCSGQGMTLAYGDKLCRKRKKLRIALRPFSSEEIPFAERLAIDLNDRFLNHLISFSGGRYEFIARSELRALTGDLFEFGQSSRPINKLLKKVEDLDILITGKLRYKSPNAILSYKALGMDGNILSSTVPQKISISPKDAKATQRTITVEQAVKTAARELADKAGHMDSLVLGSVVFEDSGGQPPFGRYVKERLSIALQDAFTNILTDRKLRIISRLGDQSNVGERVYVLRGKYWDLSNSIELRISLRNKDNQEVSWVGWIRKDTIKQRLRPSGDFGSLRDNDGLGPFDFHLTSERGANPVYRIGDNLKLKISLDRDAWIYCFNFSTNKKLYQLFPNPHFNKTHKEPRLKGGADITMPDEGHNLFPYDFQVTGPLGNELIKCLAASRDVTAELPKALRGLSSDALPKKLLYSLSSIFQQLPDVAISEASFVMTISHE